MRIQYLEVSSVTKSVPYDPSFPASLPFYDQQHSRLSEEIEYQYNVNFDDTSE